MFAEIRLQCALRDAAADQKQQLLAASWQQQHKKTPNHSRECALAQVRSRSSILSFCCLILRQAQGGGAWAMVPKRGGLCLLGELLLGNGRLFAGCLL
jgi:hypothetical protein